METGTQAMTAEIATSRHNEKSRKRNTVLKYYDDGNFGVHYVMSNAQPWFLGREIAEDLGYANGRQAITKNVRERHHKKLHELIDITGLTHNERTSTFITEAGMYALIMKVGRYRLEGRENSERNITTTGIQESFIKHAGLNCKVQTARTSEPLESGSLQPTLDLRFHPSCRPCCRSQIS